ncbi:STAS domain-containing protein [Bacillus massiliigorillae]|uniref:STAS domain-containing protein n=1 Tax=Bacillus massiliigorillae TaxID=1243664 RepID=UPI0003A0C9BC|nr:STAS domain-containing protein [Bacillus massiliigorillae]
MNQLVVTYIIENKDEILVKWMNLAREDLDFQSINLYSEQVFKETSTEFLDLIIAKEKETTEGFKVKLNSFTEKAIQIGWPLSFVSDGLTKFNIIIIDSMIHDGAISENNQTEILYNFHKWSSPMGTEIINTYTQSWEQTVLLQKIALQELSAPLIPVLEGITVMPLVGTIDTERARQIMENLLNGVVEHRSEVVLIDITGVPLVDTMVAHHIIQAAEAVRLVGATCILCGIRPEIAQTIVNLGINLNEVITKNTLKRGIEEALVLTNRKIENIDAEGIV